MKHKPHPVEKKKREGLIRAELKDMHIKDHPAWKYWLCICGNFHPRDYHAEEDPELSYVLEERREEEGSSA